MRAQILVALSVLVFFSACQGKDDGPGISPAPDTTVEDIQADDIPVCTPACDGKSCGPDGCGGQCGSCREGEETCLESGVCAPLTCQSTKDCPGKLLCWKEQGICVACTGDEDCPEGTVCGADHDCHAFYDCTSDKDCKSMDMLCDKQVGQCVECLAAEDCPKEEHCLDNYCVMDFCSPLDGKCDGDDVLACAEDGSGLIVVETCGEGTHCINASCEALACTPGELWCEGDTVTACSADGLKILQGDDCQTLSPPQNCVAGECLATVCSAGQQSCLDDVTRLVCAQDGMSEETVPCPSQQFCEEGQCKPWTCVPDEAYCAGNAAAVCNSAGSGPDSAEDCGDQICSAGTCGETLCSPGTFFCGFKAVNQCSQDGMSATLLTTCTSEQYCVESNGSAECVTQVCVPGAKVCAGDTVKKCNAKGSALETFEVCTSDANSCTNDSCLDGACVNEPIQSPECHCLSDADCFGFGYSPTCLLVPTDGGSWDSYCGNAVGAGFPGEPCDWDEDCRSGVCVDSESATFCFGLCETASDCQDGKICDAVALLDAGVTVNACTTALLECDGEPDCPEDLTCSLPVWPTPAGAPTYCANPVGSKGPGDYCLWDEQCASGFCTSYYSLSQSGSLCWSPCVQDADCEAGLFCYENVEYFLFDGGTPSLADDTYLGVFGCLPYVGSHMDCIADTDCQAGEYCAPTTDKTMTVLDPKCETAMGSGKAGTSCDVHDDCLGGWCNLPAGFCVGMCKGDWECAPGTWCTTAMLKINEKGDEVPIDVCMP